MVSSILTSLHTLIKRKIREKENEIDKHKKDKNNKNNTVNENKKIWLNPSPIDCNRLLKKHHLQKNWKIKNKKLLPIKKVTYKQQKLEEKGGSRKEMGLKVGNSFLLRLLLLILHLGKSKKFNFFTIDISLIDWKILFSLIVWKINVSYLDSQRLGKKYIGRLWVYNIVAVKHY